jgi:hypothetical protein
MHRLLVDNSELAMYKNIDLPVVLYDYETWSLTLRKERRLSMFEERVKNKNQKK